MPSAQKSSPRTVRIILLVTAILVAFIGCHYARKWMEASASHTTTTSDANADYQRIIGLSPSIVEIIYQLEQADQLVGVSRFCIG